MLTSSAGERQAPVGKFKASLSALAVAVGALCCLNTFLAYQAFPARTVALDSTVKSIGTALVSMVENG